MIPSMFFLSASNLYLSTAISDITTSGYVIQLIVREKNTLPGEVAEHNCSNMNGHFPQLHGLF